ncbi:hypothetical protein CR513_11410, partial [Mucuna pruriens]
MLGLKIFLKTLNILCGSFAHGSLPTNLFMFLHHVSSNFSCHVYGSTHESLLRALRYCLKQKEFANCSIKFFIPTFSPKINLLGSNAIQPVHLATCLLSPVGIHGRLIMKKIFKIKYGQIGFFFSPDEIIAEHTVKENKGYRVILYKSGSHIALKMITKGVHSLHPRVPLVNIICDFKHALGISSFNIFFTNGICVLIHEPK